jgi:hypothetical protein
MLLGPHQKPVTPISRHQVCQFRKIDKSYYYLERVRVFHFLNKISVLTSPKVPISLKLPNIAEIFWQKTCVKSFLKNGV